MITAVFDTNVFISAFEFGGLPRKAFLLSASGVFELCTSQALLDELTGVLQDRFGYSEERVREVRARLRSLCANVEPSRKIVACDDPDDNRVLECAVAANASYIVTGDNALLRLSPFKGIEILRVAAFLEKTPWGRTGR